MTARIQSGGIANRCAASSTKAAMSPAAAPPEGLLAIGSQLAALRKPTRKMAKALHAQNRQPIRSQNLSRRAGVGDAA
jgi:hypothetical protein